MDSKKDINIKYLMTSRQDQSWGITVNSVGFQRVGRGEPYPPRKHPAGYMFSPERGRVLDEYQLVYTVGGKGTFTTDSQKNYEIEAGSMYMIFPGQWHSYGPDPATGWDEYWIGFTGTNIDNRVQAGFFTAQKSVFNVGVQEDLVRLFELAITTAREEKAGFQQMLGGIVNMLLGYTYYYDRNFSSDNLNVANKINRARIMMRERFRENISPEDIAADVNMGYSWFRHMFKIYTGFAPNQYILELRIRHGKSLLTNTPRTIKEIAYESGFENQEYFCTLFRKKTGMTPLKYRTATQADAVGGLEPDSDI